MKTAAGVAGRPKVPLAFFLPTLGCGGAEDVFVAFASALNTRGWDVELVVANGRPQGSLRRRDLPTGVRLADLGASRMITALPALVRYLRRHRPPVLFATIVQGNMAAILSRAIARTPTRIIIRETTGIRALAACVGNPKERLVAWLLRFVYPWADAIIAPSRGAAAELTSALGPHAPEVKVIYNPLDHSRVRSAPLDSPGHPWLLENSTPVILAVGRLCRAKNFPLLLRAFAKVRSKRVCQLLIFGEGDERNRLGSLAFELGIAKDVAMPGFIPNPVPAMNRCAVFALSSDYEGMPNVLIHAVGVGANVVATDCEHGPREILEGGRWGRLVRPGDTDAFARSLEAALDQGAAQSRKQAMNYAERAFSIDAVLDSLVQIATADDNRPSPESR